MPKKQLIGIFFTLTLLLMDILWVNAQEINCAVTKISYYKVVDVTKETIVLHEFNAKQVLEYKYHNNRKNMPSYNEMTMRIEFSCGIQTDDKTIHFICRPPEKGDFISQMKVTLNEGATTPLSIFCPVSQEQTKLFLEEEKRINNAKMNKKNTSE